MLRSSAAVASRVLRLIGASSRPSILLYQRPITTVSINSIRQFLFFDPKHQFVADQSRSYARGRRASSSDDDEDTDEFEFDEVKDEFDEDFDDSEDDDFEDDDDDTEDDSD